MEEYIQFKINTRQIKGAGCLEFVDQRDLGNEVKLIFKICSEYEVNTTFGLKQLYGLQQVQKMIFGERVITIKRSNFKVSGDGMFEAEAEYSLWVKTADVECVKKEIESACKSSMSGQLSDDDQLDLFN